MYIYIYIFIADEVRLNNEIGTVKVFLVTFEYKKDDTSCNLMPSFNEKRKRIRRIICQIKRKKPRKEEKK